MRINFHLVFHYLRHFIQAKRGGHGVHSPIVYRLSEDLFYNSEPFYDFRKLNAVRKRLLNDHRTISVDDLGAGSKTFKGRERKISSIAARGNSSSKQSELIFRLIVYFKCNVCIELGTSLGLNTLYMATAAKGGTVFSIEGSEVLHQHSKALAANTRMNNIVFIEGDFDQTLGPLLQQLEQVDLVYLDGNHTFEATLRYFNMLLPCLHERSVLVVDDIYWSRGMSSAWKMICKNEKVRCTIDLFQCGIVLFDKAFREKVREKIWY